jgi:hypothetical protein
VLFRSERVGDSAGVIEMTGTITRVGIPGAPQGETSDNATEVICLCYRMKEVAGDSQKKSGEIEGYLDWCDRNVRSRISGNLSESGNLEFRIIENSTILGSPESMNWLHNLAFSGHFNDGELAGSLSIQYNVQTPCLNQGEIRLDLFSIPKEVAYMKKSDSKDRVTETLSVRDGRPEGEYIITVEAFPRKSKQSENIKEEFKEDNESRSFQESLNTYGLCSGQGSAWIQWYIEKSSGSISFGVLSEDAMSTSDSCVFANPDVWCFNVQGSASHSTDISVTAMANVGDIISVRIDTDQGILEFYRNDNFIHHFSNLRDHPAFVNVEDSNSNGLRLFVCLCSEGDAVKFLGPKDGAVNVKYCDETKSKVSVPALPALTSCGNKIYRFFGYDAYNSAQDVVLEYDLLKSIFNNNVGYNPYNNTESSFNQFKGSNSDFNVESKINITETNIVKSASTPILEKEMQTTKSPGEPSLNNSKIAVDKKDRFFTKDMTLWDYVQAVLTIIVLVVGGILLLGEALGLINSGSSNEWRRP